MKAGRYFGLLCTLIMIFTGLVSPATVFAGADSETETESASVLAPVRVGVVEQPGYCTPDEDGYMRGLDAEYMYKIAQYAGLTAEFVSFTSYTQLQEAVEAGDADMALGLSKSEEREGKFLFAETPFATGPLSLRVREDDDRYETLDTAMLSDMRIGVVVSGSNQKEKALAWSEENGIELHITDYDGEDSMYADIEAGKLDAIISGGLIAPGYRTVLSFTATAYYPIFNRSQTDLKLKVDAAMNRILREDPQYAEKLIQKYLAAEGEAIPSFTAEEWDYIEEHPTIRVAIMSPDAPYYIPDSSTKAGARGIVVDYYREIGEITGLQFIWQEYETQDEVYEAVKNGEADIMAIVHRGVIEATKAGLILTAGYMTQDVVRIARNGVTDYEKSALVEPDVKNYQYLAGEGKHEELVGYKNVQACFNALRAKKVDSVICTMTQATWIMNQNRFAGYQVATLYGRTLTSSGAVMPENALLAQIISRAAGSSQIISKTSSPRIRAPGCP